jgi:hypothetical protein
MDARATVAQKRAAHARSAPEAFAVWVAMKSISGGDRQS